MRVQRQGAKNDSRDRAHLVETVAEDNHTVQFTKDFNHQIAAAGHRFYSRC